VLELIVRRPKVGEREVLSEATLNAAEGLVGDSWLLRGSSRTPNGGANPEMQLNIMSARTIALIAGDKSRWPLAGDQLFIDLDLSEDNLPAGTKLAINAAVIEITRVPHLGCAKFSKRYGPDATTFVNSSLGKQLHLRGLNARIVTPGTIRTGDTVTKI